MDKRSKAAGVLAMMVTVALAVSAAPSPAHAQVSGMNNVRTIRVSGVGEVRVEPDLATVQFAVETTGATAEEAGQANAVAMDRVIQAILGAGVAQADVQTSGYSLYPEYVRRPGDENAPPMIRGYRAMNMVSVRTRSLDEVGPLIDVGLAAGANRLEGVSFELTNSAAAEAEALALAVQEARAAAETMATALGVTLGQVIDASTGAEPPQPFYRMYAEAGMARDMAASVTPIQPGEQTVRAQASVVYEIR